MATILKPQPENGTEISYPDNASLAYCGAKDCPDNGADNPNLQNPSKAIVTTRMSIIVFSNVGLLIMGQRLRHWPINNSALGQRLTGYTGNTRVAPVLG